MARGTKKNQESTGGYRRHSRFADGRQIHPIIVYPFSQPRDMRDLEALYDQLVKKLSEQPERFARPMTVVNRQTYYRNAAKAKTPFTDFMVSRVRKYSEIVDAWSVDTCQMWLSGFGRAFDQKHTVDDVFWLIPGDFNYSTKTGQEVLRRFEDIPRMVESGEAELCLGEITVPVNSSKQLIDTYGTYGLLYNWFPAEAQGIRRITDKPRTEFLAISHDYLKTVLLKQRWYAYEQTIVILLEGMQGDRPMREIRKIALGDISDIPIGRDTLASAMQQVERTERVLKLYWRELNERQDALWPEKFRRLDHQSEQIRGSAMVILQQILDH